MYEISSRNIRKNFKTNLNFKIINSQIHLTDLNIEEKIIQMS
jgi:hypothetical protein